MNANQFFQNNSVVTSRPVSWKSIAHDYAKEVGVGRSKKSQNYYLSFGNEGVGVVVPFDFFSHLTIDNPHL